MTASVRASSYVAVAGALMFGASELQAQSCLGLPSLSMSSRNISATGTGSGSNRTLGVRYGVGREHVFGGVQLGYAAMDFTKPRATIFGLDAGYAVPLGQSKATQLCITLNSAYQYGPETYFYNQRSLATSLGLSLGRSFQVSRSLAVVPHVQTGVVYGRSWFRLNPVTTTDGAGSTVSRLDEYVEARLGLGLRFRDVLTLTPSLSRSFGNVGFERGREATYSLGLSFGFPK